MNEGGTLDLDDAWEWDDDWAYEEPPAIVTYADTVRRLTALADSRPDVRIEWSGGRGPRGDARIVFSGSDGCPILRFRLHSAAENDAALRLVEHLYPLPEHRALWDSSTGTVTAWLAGPRDDIIETLARRIFPELGRGTLTEEHPAFINALESLHSDELATRDPRPGQPERRTIRLTTTGDELHLAYGGGRRRGLPGIALELTCFAVADAAAAKEALTSYGVACARPCNRANSRAFCETVESWPRSATPR